MNVQKPPWLCVKRAEAAGLQPDFFGTGISDFSLDPTVDV